MSDQIRAGLIPLAFQSLTPDAVSGPADSTKANTTVGVDAVMLEITTAGQALYYRVDGGEPTATIGMRIAAGSKAEIWGTDAIRKLRFINAVAGGVIGITSYYSRAR